MFKKYLWLYESDSNTMGSRVCKLFCRYREIEKAKDKRVYIKFPRDKD